MGHRDGEDGGDREREEDGRVRESLRSSNEMLHAIVEASPADNGMVLLVVTTIPTAGVSDAGERQQILRSASGVTVHASARTWEVTVNPQALA